MGKILAPAEDLFLQSCPFKTIFVFSRNLSNFGKLSKKYNIFFFKYINYPKILNIKNYLKTKIVSYFFFDFRRLVFKQKYPVPPFQNPGGPLSSSRTTLPLSNIG